MPNLNLDQVASNQNQKEVTINDAFAQVDEALTEALTVDLSAGDAALTADQWTRNWLFNCSGHTVTRTLTMPATKRPAVVKNAGIGMVTLQVVGGGSAVVQPGQTVMVYNDGANLTVAGGGLSDAPSDGGTYARKNAAWVGVPVPPVTADTKPDTPSDWDDEFEYGTALDTTGARRAGAKAWSVIASASGDANPVMSGWIITKTALKASMVAPTGSFKFRGKFTVPGAPVAANVIECGLFLIGPSSATGLELYNNGAKNGTDVMKASTSLVWSSDLSTAATGSDFSVSRAWCYEIEYDGTNVYLRVSANGIAFRQLYSDTAASLLGGAPSAIAISLKDTGSGGSGACCDWVRRIA